MSFTPEKFCALCYAIKNPDDDSANISLLALVRGKKLEAKTASIEFSITKKIGGYDSQTKESILLLQFERDESSDYTYEKLDKTPIEISSEFYGMTEDEIFSKLVTGFPYHPPMTDVIFTTEKLSDTSSGFFIKKEEIIELKNNLFKLSPYAKAFYKVTFKNENIFKCSLDLNFFDEIPEYNIYNSNVFLREKFVEVKHLCTANPFGFLIDFYVSYYSNNLKGDFLKACSNLDNDPSKEIYVRSSLDNIAAKHLQEAFNLDEKNSKFYIKKLWLDISRIRNKDSSHNYSNVVKNCYLFGHSDAIDASLKEIESLSDCIRSRPTDQIKEIQEKYDEIAHEKLKDIQENEAYIQLLKNDIQDLEKKSSEERERLEKENKDYAKELKKRAQNAAAALEKAAAKAMAARAEAESDLKARKDDLKALENQIRQLELQKNRTAEALEEKRRLAEAVDAEIQKKLSGATAEIARVIAGMPFLSALGLGASVAAPRPAAMAEKAPAWRFSFPRSGGESAVAVSAPEDCLGLLEDNLSDIGVDPRRNRALAAFLYASFVNRQTLLLAGPCGKRISEALSLSVCGEQAARLDCFGPFDQAALEEVRKTDAQVVMICSPLRPEWAEPLMLFADETDKHLLFIHPFEEDLRVEPKDLFNYMLPVLTATAIADITDKKLAAAKFREGFKHFAPTGGELAHGRLLTRMEMPALARARLKRTLSVARSLLSGEELREEAEYLYGLLPYAYVAGQTEKLSDFLARSHLDPSLKSLLKHSPEEAFFRLTGKH